MYFYCYMKHFNITLRPQTDSSLFIRKNSVYILLYTVLLFVIMLVCVTFLWICMCTGEMVTKQPLIRSMRTVKRETLKLISGWVSRSNDPQMVGYTYAYRHTYTQPTLFLHFFWAHF